jgi:hypothetical protein
MSKHATYAPSDAERWGPGGCDIALTLFPKTGGNDSLESLEGTFAHALLELCLRHQKRPSDYLNKECFYGIIPKDYEGKRPDTHCRQDMIDAIEPVIDYISDRFFHIENEVPVLWSEAHTVLVPDLCEGTVDCALYWEKAGVLEIIDLKYGKGIMVEADTPQLGIYAAGIARDMKCKKLNKVLTTVAQPRGHHPAGVIRTYERSGADLMLFAENIKGRIEYLEKLNGTGKGNPSKGACMWCPGRKQGCEWRTNVATEEAIKVVDVAEKILDVPSGTPFTEDELFLIENAEIIEQVLTAARARLVDQILSGGEGHGYVLEEGRANRIFKHGEEEMKKILNKQFRLKVADITTPKLNGIPAIEKVAKKNLSEAKLAEFQTLIEKPRGKPKLVLASEAKGKPYQSAETMFEKTDEVDFL